MLGINLNHIKKSVSAYPYISLVLLSVVAFYANAKPNVEVSGFSRLVAGYLDESFASYEGYDNSISVSERSLFGLQIDAELNSRWSASAQLLAHSSDSRDSGLEWLYLTYQASLSTTIKAGRMRTPFFAYSDILDVGYAYPWVSPQQQVYNAYVFDKYEGLMFNYQLPNSELQIEFEGYLGTFKDVVQVNPEFQADRFLDLEFDVFAGLALMVKKDEWSFRLSHYEMSTFLDYPESEDFKDLLNSVGYARSAASLVNEGQTTISELAIFYDDINRFVKSEFISINSDLVSIPDINSFYASVGFIRYPFTYHLTVANNDSSYNKAVVEIPLGLSTELDALYAQYQLIFDIFPVDSLTSYTVGSRWDFKPNMALKFDVSLLKGKQGERGFFDISDTDQFDHNSVLYELAWEWVF